MLIEAFLSLFSNWNEAATFGYLRVRVFAQRVREDLWLSATAPLLTAGDGLEGANARPEGLFRGDDGFCKEVLSFGVNR
jgi:hypothetical protein